ncbi:alpha/beta hydrolase [Mangrovimonas sp. AS39]|uniref:alpha/beta hydrolase n=1 Tax=Mangrovimonas futianensis TaxID=2895523 RepID=UPI001E431CE7|nr:alpha/beta hydrolase [Mangrovimonas futianensis]MCF1191947.1 alpha/beta hydrolase [Mangrovimonas futianensis]MCF1195641.1 alpha/beta hydrolase [Mangrovimonas futianensis]MCF1422385.1 alpha/beta hydrolase [Mangrovimonas futianensis]
MDQELIHVYFMPGMAAKSTIFEKIELPKDQFEMHFLEWIIPLKNESIQSYAKRLCENIEHDNIVLVGVSFGGIMVQEMSKIIKTRKIIVVSSVKTKYELPRRMRAMRALKAYCLIPKEFQANVDKLAKFAFGKTATERIDLYRKFLYINDPSYLKWAIKQVVCWDQNKPLPNTIHIHGDKDLVFPKRYIKDCECVKGGTHIMVVNRFKWFNEHLPNLILS